MRVRNDQMFDYLDGSMGTSHGYSNVGASTEVGEPLLNCGSGISIGKTVWYSFTSGIPAARQFDTYGSSVDTVLAVYTGPSVDALALVVCDDDYFGFATQSRVVFFAAPGETYWIQVGTWGNGAPGTIYLNHDFDADCPGDTDCDGDLDGADNCPEFANGTQQNYDIQRLGVGSFDRSNPNGDRLGDFCEWDDDNDGLPDDFELGQGTCPGLLSPLDPPQCHVNSNPGNPLIPNADDTDRDRYSDYAEYLYMSNPLNLASRSCMTGDCVDGDSDGIPNTVETLIGSNPGWNASDADGVSDRLEVLFHTTSPISTDTDVLLGACDDRIEIFSNDGTNNVAFADLIQFAGAYTSTGPAAVGGETGAWDANKDYDGNSTVAFADLIIFAAAYTQACGAGIDLAP